VEKEEKTRSNMMRRIDSGGVCGSAFQLRVAEIPEAEL
jgi:hypothetical protein